METTTKVKAPGLVLAVRLLWITLILGFFTWMVSVSENQTTLRVIIFAVVIYAISSSIAAWVIMKISAGRNWARIVYLGFFIIGAPFSLMAMWTNPHLLKFILVASHFILILTALYLIFLGTGASEFEKFSLKSTKSKIFLVIFIIATFIIWTVPFLNSGVKKDDWVKGMKLGMPAVFCNDVVSNHEAAAVLKEKDISYEKCVSLVSKGVIDQCIKKYYSELPDKLSIVAGGAWGEKIGRCVGEEFYDKYLADTNKK